MKVLILLISLACVGCYQELPIIPMLSIDPTFQPYLDDFIREGRAQGKPIVVNNLIIRFSNSLTSETLGECFMFANGTDGVPTILIDAQDWPDETEDYRKVVLMHELGHCILWRQHLLTFNGPNGNITSIMYPYIDNDTSVYTNNWGYYMNELFNGY